MSESEGAMAPGQSPPEEAGEQAPRRRAPRWMKILLIASLGINLAVAGYAISWFAAGPRFIAAGPASSLMDARKLLWLMPREERDELRDEFLGRHSYEFNENRQRWNDARQNLARTLKRSDASDDDIREAFEELGEVEANAAVRMREILAELTIRAEAEDRAEFADRLDHDHRHDEHWRDRPGFGRPPGPRHD